MKKIVLALKTKFLGVFRLQHKETLDTDYSYGEFGHRNRQYLDKHKQHLVEQNRLKPLNYKYFSTIDVSVTKQENHRTESEE